jgi:hypothetical protein
MAAKLCLKARPTSVQLADRLAPIDGRSADGLELYLAAADIADQAAMHGVVERLSGCGMPDGFALLIEGPVDSLDGRDFDVTRDSEADAEVVRRLADLTRRIGARAVNIHLIAPSPDLGRLTLACREELLQRAVPFLSRFVELVREAGAVPTIENMPPVLRMRRGDFAFTAIGIASADLAWMAERVPGLAVMPDTSHAGLYLNARLSQVEENYAWVEPLQAYLRQLPAEPTFELGARRPPRPPRVAKESSTDGDLLGFCKALEPWVANAQISNATGLLGEGAPYAEGDFDLDPVIAWLGEHTQHIVTETLEPNQDDARYMRDALRRTRAVLS